jgi:hypothetical protein
VSEGASPPDTKSNPLAQASAAGAYSGHRPAAVSPRGPRGGHPVSSAGTDHFSDFAEPSEVAIIHDAARALKHDRDPETALKLLSQVNRNGNGPLAEEAQALSVEAAIARRDPMASTLAREYLARYPHGRYRDMVSTALLHGPAR